MTESSGTPVSAQSTITHRITSTRPTLADLTTLSLIVREEEIASAVNAFVTDAAIPGRFSRVDTASAITSPANGTRESSVPVMVGASAGTALAILDGRAIAAAVKLLRRPVWRLILGNIARIMGIAYAANANVIKKGIFGIRGSTVINARVARVFARNLDPVFNALFMKPGI